MTRNSWGIDNEKDDKRFKLKLDAKAAAALNFDLDRPNERVRQSFADKMLAEARAELAAERARETPEQKAERERLEAEQENDRFHGREL